MKKIGLSIGALQARYGIERALQICAESGFDAVDLNLKSYGRGTFPVYADGEDAILSYFSRIGEYARSLGLTISQTHGRTRIATSDEAFSKQMKWVTQADLLATKALGAPYCVIHSLTTKAFPNADGEWMQRNNLAFFSELSRYAEQYGVSIALETFGDSEANGVRVIDYFGDSRELKRCYDALDTPNKAICLDTGHTNKAYAIGTPDGQAVPSPVEAVHLFGNAIRVLHLNDNNGFTDQHLPPMCKMEGGVAWSELYAALDAIGYDGVYNFELSLANYGAALEDAVHFLGGYLRQSVEGKL